jgi:hypothetical protein
VCIVFTHMLLSFWALWSVTSEPVGQHFRCLHKSTVLQETSRCSAKSFNVLNICGFREIMISIVDKQFDSSSASILNWATGACLCNSI